MADQKLTDSGLQKLENDLSTKSGIINQRIQTLQSTIDSLEGAWKGIGAGAFNQKQTMINLEMRKLQTILGRYQEAIGETRKLGASNEDEVGQTLNGIDVESSGTSSLGGL